MEKAFQVEMLEEYRPKDHSEASDDVDISLKFKRVQCL